MSGRNGVEIARWEIAPHWEWTRLGEVMSVIRGASPRPKGDPKYFGGNIPWIMIADVTRADGKFLYKTRESVTDLGATKSRHLAKGALILSNSGTVCVPKFLAVDGCIHDGFVTFPDIPTGIDADFLYHLFLRLRPLAIETFRQGMTQVNLNTDIVRNLSLPIPPANEQRRIVAKIEALQERSRKAREALSEVGPLLEQFRQSLLAAAFRGDLTADWRAENPDVEPASQLLTRIRQERRERWEQAELAKYEIKGKKPPKGWKEKYKEPEPVDDSELPELPEGWSWESLELLCPAEYPIVYGIILPGPHVPDGVPFVRPADISSDGQIEFEKLPRTSPEIAQKYHRASLEAGDLIFSVVGTIGKWLIAPPELTGGNITQSSVRIRPFDPITPIFILRSLQSSSVVRQMERLQFGNAVQRLNVEHMRRLAIPLPPAAEAKEISRIVESSLGAIRQHFANVEESKIELAQLDQSILAKAFRGELVPQDPNDEPASVLLYRIHKERDAAGKKAKMPARRKRTGHPAQTPPTTTPPPKVSQCVLLLLKVWGKPVPFPLLEAGVRLMLEPELQDAIIKPRRGRKKANAAAVPLLTGMDQIYRSLVSKEAISLVGKHAYQLNVENKGIVRLLDESSFRMAENAITALESMMQRRKLDEEEAGIAVAQMVSQSYVATANV